MLTGKKIKKEDGFQSGELNLKKVNKITELLNGKNIRNSKYCREWLKKLTDSCDQVPLRNQYLDTLYHQIQNNKLSDMFTHPPPKKLSELRDHTNSQEDNLSDDTLGSSDPLLKLSMLCDSDSDISLTVHKKESPRDMQLKIYKSLNHELYKCANKLKTQKSSLLKQLTECECCNYNYRDDIKYMQQVMREQAIEIDSLKFRLQTEEQKAKSLRNSVKMKDLEIMKLESNKNNEDGQLVNNVKQEFLKILNDKEKEIELKVESSVVQMKDSILSTFSKYQEMNNPSQNKEEAKPTQKAQLTLMKEEFENVKDKIEKIDVKQHKILTEKLQMMFTKLLQTVKSDQTKRRFQEYKQKVEQILQEKDLEIKTLKTKIKKKNSEISMILCSESQWETEILLNQLENKYRQMMSTSRKKYLERIMNLETKIFNLETQMNYLNNRSPPTATLV